jgi:hypothetical protein
MEGFTEIKFIVDGKISKEYSSGKSLSDDTTEHSVVFVGTYNGNDVDNNLYIQANRVDKTNVDLTYEVWDIMLNEGTSPLPWSYSSKDW